MVSLGEAFSDRYLKLFGKVGLADREVDDASSREFSALTKKCIRELVARHLLTGSRKSHTGQASVPN